MNNKGQNANVRKVMNTIAILIIIGSIIYLEKSKANPVDMGEVDVELKLGKYPKAPEITGTQEWINSEPLTLEELKGKVVMIDFWTYTCINCIRTMPYLNDWYEKYKDDGFVIIGVHSPEFAFEKKLENVQKAVDLRQIKFPVVQDNDFFTWRSYENRHWPHKYLIDIDGFIRYDHIGEGSYEKTEKAIQDLLAEKKKRMQEEDNSKIDLADPEEAVDVDFKNIKTPEIYFGSKLHRGNFGNSGGLKKNQEAKYELPEKFKPNNVYIEGIWKSDNDGMKLLSSTGVVTLTYTAKNVNIVAGSEEKTTATIYLDDEKIAKENFGEHVKDSKVNVKEHDLYNLVSTPDYGTHTIRIEATKGFEIYTFTFG